MNPSAAPPPAPLGLFPGRPAPRLYDRLVEVLRTRPDSGGTGKLSVDCGRSAYFSHRYPKPIRLTGPRPWTHVPRPLSDIRTVQELLGHKDVTTTMIDTHVLNKGGRGVRSPADGL